MSTLQRKAFASKFQKAVVKVCKLPEVDKSVARPLPSTSSNESTASICKISIQPDESRILYPPFSIVEEIFQDASAIVNGNGVLQAPGSSITYIVANEEKANNPFVISINNNAVECSSEKCLKFKAYKICSHAIAVAETHGSLGPYLAQFNLTNRQSISALVDIGHSSNA
eukprot:gene14441-15945_t